MRRRLKTQTPARRTAAFTLVELLIVLAIIAVIGTISIPTLASLGSPKHALRKEGRRLMALMQEARTAAMTRKIRINIIVDPHLNEVRAIEASHYRSMLPRDSVLPHTEEEGLWSASNRFERVIAFGQDMELNAFSAEEISLLGESDDPFQDADSALSASPPMTDTDEPLERVAITFTHFGGSDGGGVSLSREAHRLDMAADILTGRPRLVRRSPQTLDSPQT